jgi:hypothetical protein
MRFRWVFLVIPVALIGVLLLKNVSRAATEDEWDNEEVLKAKQLRNRKDGSVRRSHAHAPAIHRNLTTIKKQDYCTLDADLTKYPPTNPITTITANWNPDDPNPPAKMYDTLCHFNYANVADRTIAERFREEEVPFVVYNVPSVDDTCKKWTWKYLKRHMATSSQKVETSNAGKGKENHFMYHANSWKYKQSHPEYDEPTSIENMNFGQWLAKAQTGEPNNMTKSTPLTEEENKHKQHWYMMTVSTKDPFIYSDLDLFKREKSFFIVEPAAYRGIHCRFGMRGIVAEAHFDGGRNMIAMLKGAKRYVLMNPNQCPNLYLLPKSHPSGRHSQVDWSEPDFDKHPLFKNAVGTETILKAGQVLYVPTHWIHYIQSLGMSVQCNCRSGTPLKQLEVVKGCGFYLTRNDAYWAKKKARGQAEYEQFLQDPGALNSFHGS